MAYFIQYLLKWRDQSNKAGCKGTIVHHVLEILALIKLADQMEEITITDKVCGQLGVNNYLNKKKDLDKLTQKIYNYYSKEENHLTWEKGDLANCQKWIEKTLTFNNGIFDPRNKNVKDAEQYFEFPFDDIILRGYIDLIVEIEPQVIEIIDWKSGSTRKDWVTGKIKNHHELRQDIQLRLYHYAAHKLYPDAKQILVTIFYINAGGPFTICFDESDLEITENTIRERIQLIRSVNMPRCNKSWKCNRFCGAGMTTFENTHIQPLKKNDQIMTKCEQVRYVLQHRTIESVVENMFFQPKDSLGD